MKIALVVVLLLSSIASCFSAGFFLVFIEAGLQKRGVNPKLSVVSWLCLPLAIAVYLSIPAALMVAFTSDPVRHTIAIVLLSLPPILIPFVTLITIVRAGWEEITGHPAAHGGRPPGRLAIVGSLVLMQGLHLLPPVAAWLISPFY